MKHLAFIDLETTGLDPERHEILEIGVIGVDPRTLDECDVLEVRVRPEHIDNADPVALELIGYTPDAWADAIPLREALARIAPLLDCAILAGHNVGFDRAFLDAAWKRTRVEPPAMDHHVIDTATLAWPLVASGLIDSLSLSTVCAELGIALEPAHRALTDARRSLAVARRMLPDAAHTARRGALVRDGHTTVETCGIPLHLAHDGGVP